MPLAALPAAGQTGGTLLAQLKEQHLLCGSMSFAFEADGRIELLDMLDDDIDFQMPPSAATSDANRIEIKVPGIGAPFVITRDGDKLVHNQAVCEKKK